MRNKGTTNDNCVTLCTKISLYKSVIATTPTDYIDKDSVYSLFRSSFQTETNDIQAKFSTAIAGGFQDGKKQYQEAKKILPVVCFAGNIDRSQPTQDDFSHSGVLSLDIDEDTPDELRAFYARIQKGELTHVEAAGRSVSGFATGALWVNIRIEVPNGAIPGTLSKLLGLSGGETYYERVKVLHAAYWSAISHFFKAKYGIQVGHAGKDLKRARYIAHDSGMYYNPGAGLFSLQDLEDVLKAERAEHLERNEVHALNIEHTTDAYLYAERFAAAKGYTFALGQKHNYRNALCIALNLLGISKQDAERFIVEKYAPKDGLSNEIDYPYAQYRTSHGAWAGRLVPDDITPSQVVHLMEGQRISDYAKQVVSYILERKKIEIEAGTGTGKNYAVMNHIAPLLKEKTGLGSVIVCSLNSKTEKDARAYGVPFLTGQRLKEAGQYAPGVIREALESDTILCNQDYFPTLAKRLNDRNELRHVFVDESHTLVNDYKKKTIRRLWDSLEHAASVTMLSGTPKPYFALLGYNRLTFVQDVRNRINTTVKEYEGNEVDAVIGLIKKIDFTKRKAIIKIQSKEKIELIRRNLVEVRHFQETDIVVLTSDKSVKNSTHYQDFLDATAGGDSFPGAKIVLCTSFVNEGLDIYSEQDILFVNVEKAGNFSPDDLVQFAGRWRTNNDVQLISLHKKPGDPWKQNQRNWLYEYEQFLAYQQEKADDLERMRIKFSGVYSVQSLAHTRTAYSDAERFILHTGTGYQVDVLECANYVESLRIQGTGTRHGWENIEKKYPYFRVVYEDAPEQRVLYACANVKAAYKAEKEQAEAVIAGLVLNDTETFLQAVASTTEDTGLKRQISFEVERMNDAHEINQLPEMQKHAGTAEKIAKNVVRIARMGFGLDGAREIVSWSLSDQKLRAFLEGVKLHVLMELFRLAKEQHRAGLPVAILTAQQVRDAQRIEAYLDAMQKKGEGISSMFALRALKGAYKGKRIDFTKQKALDLAKVFFSGYDYRLQDETFFTIRKSCDLSDFLTRNGMSEENTQNLYNSLINNVLRCKTDNSFLYKE